MTDDEALALIKALTAQLRKVQGEVTRHGFTGQASRGEVTPFALNGGLLRRGFNARASTGSTGVTGSAASLPQGVAWRAFPRTITIDRTKPFPQYPLVNVRRDFLMDPGNRVTSVELIDV